MSSETSQAMAHTVIRRYRSSPTNIDEIIRRAEVGFVPLIRRAPGFRRYTMADAGGGELFTISTFETKAQAEDSVRLAAGWVKENLAALLPNPPEVIEGAVRLRHANPGAQAKYGVVRRYQMDPANVDELVRRVEQEFVPIVSALPGFVAYSALDTGNGAVISLSSFADKAAAEESTHAAAGWVRERLAALLPNPPEVTPAEIRVSVSA